MKPVFFGTKTAEEENIVEHDFKLLFESKEYKNGCVVSNWTSEGMVAMYDDIKAKSVQLIELELKK